MEGIYYLGSIRIEDLVFNELKLYYEKVFKKELKRKSREERMSEKTFIYIIGNLEQKLFKIGNSKTVYKRLEALQTGCPFNLIIIGSVLSEKRFEKELHIKYKEYRVKGEWFKFEDIFNDKYLKSVFKFA